MAKILHVEETINRTNEELPPDVIMGLRVYPPPSQGPKPGDPGLRVPLTIEKRARMWRELKGLNPRKKASLGPHLRKALRDFPEGEDTKLLFLLCDDADTGATPFCGEETAFRPPEGLRFYALSLNMKNPADQEELNCLSRKLKGKTVHLSGRDRILEALLPFCRKAHRDEAERQRRVQEEEKRRQELLSKTRLKVEFLNTLDAFFADSVEISHYRLNGEETPLAPSVRLGQGEASLLFDRAVSEGTHELALQYKKWKDGKAVDSIEGVLQVEVEEGKTSYVHSYPRGALFHWDFHFKARSF
jgi:hypothetical protein